MATTNPTDPNKIRLTGENSFIRLSDDASSEETTRASHWRVLWSPGGTGHVLFLQSELTDNEVQIYSDNIALTRWLQDEIESLLHPPFADQTMQVVDAEFTRKGDPSTFWTETIISDEAEIAMTWHDFMEPYMLVVPAGSASGRPHGVYSCFIPARKAQLTINGDVANGNVSTDRRGDKDSSSACLAWSETWVRP
ncbi:hypothetical protein MGWOODY_Clf379 [hydrothermal vent metagenome]|uniref:Uncharacterized protein n=1 Tax=hydrothermal vent metagenome TaxID=652676 RepID=A0A160V8B8_9ZZZZ|tara:strand:+ start:2403 stop:2987 length:585 start_codon:yes stop_codon:yes gene_type:complete